MRGDRAGVSDETVVPQCARENNKATGNLGARLGVDY